MMTMASMTIMARMMIPKTRQTELSVPNEMHDRFQLSHSARNQLNGQV